MGAMEEDTTVFDYLRERLSQEPALWIWPLLFVAAIPEIVRSVKIIAFGQELRFDGSARTIVKNGGEQSFSFDEVGHLQIRTIDGGEGGDSSRLTLILKDGRKIEIERSDDGADIMALTDDGADILNVPIVRK